MRQNNIHEKVQCEDCGRWLPLHIFLKHWHEVPESILEASYDTIATRA